MSRLAEDEQKACRALWKKVDQLRPEPEKVKRAEGITNTIGMKLTPILPGEFRMGSPADDKEANDSEKPQHRVRISRPFYLGVHEVTQAEYLKVMGENPSFFSANGRGQDWVAGRSTARYPVENVSWLDAVKFCNKLSEKEGWKPFYEIDGEKGARPGLERDGLSPADRGRVGIRLPRRRDVSILLRRRSQRDRELCLVQGQFQGNYTTRWSVETESFRFIRHAGKRVGVVRRHAPWVRQTERSSHDRSTRP